VFALGAFFAIIHWLNLGYRWLYEIPKILHRDISLDNLMLRKKGNKVYTVLNDFDLAVSADVKSKSSRHRTGTKPFMAIDLIHPDPTVHMYRHDLESMFYVLVWITSRFHDGQEISNPPLQEWADTGDLILVEKKRSFYMSMPPRRTQQFESFGRWIVSMQTMFRDGFSLKTKYLAELSVAGLETSPPYFEDETVGGLVTFNKFQAILDTQLL
jgi:serine/threonine protein kinase